MEQQEPQAKSKKADRTKHYAFVVYPDSAPKEWKKILEATHVPMLISPFHDKDVNQDGTIKKPHWHVLVMFDTLKSKKQFEELRDLVDGVGVEKVASLRGYARYLVHMDNPEKAQYSKDDIVALNGANYEKATYLPMDDVMMLAEMVQFCVDNKIDSFAKFVMICKDENHDWFTTLAHRTTYFMDKFIKSLSWTIESGRSVDGKKKMLLVDPETGEEREVYM